MNVLRVEVKYNELGLLFKNGRLVDVLSEGIHWAWSWRYPIEIAIKSPQAVSIVHADIEQLSKCDLLADKATFVDLKENERAFLWIDGRFERVLKPGLYGYWNQGRDIKVERVDANELQVVRNDMTRILKSTGAGLLLDVTEIPEGKVGVLYVNGEYRKVLPSGKHFFWRDVAKVKIHVVDQRDQILDVSGQDIMTQDKVTLRLNALVSCRIVDARKYLEASQDALQSLYRETQLVLRAEVGSRSLDALLSDKESLAASAKQAVLNKGKALGIEVISVGVRDVILPGDMKELLNQVIEAQKASEANGIKRREETAAMRSQLNTAKLLESNPMLMKLRELEVLENIAKTSNLSVVLGEKSLTESVTKLI
ncbi:slipin family protein [Puniceicoccaceae bacterium K14]|nr:slipin family protein [Puniceicoccaceae bacterium K14]